MADTWLDPRPAPDPARDQVPDRVSGPRADDRADSGYAVPPVPAGLDDQPGPHRVAWAGRRSVMTEAPAQRREQPGPLSPGPAGAHQAGTGEAGTGMAGGGPAATPVSPGILPPRNRWSRVGWMFAAIWLVYLAQPIGKLWSDPNLARRYLGLADLIAFAVLFIVTFAAARSLRTFRNRQISRG